MANLRDRLKRIHEQTKMQETCAISRSISGFLDSGWRLCAENVLKRDVIKVMPFNTQKKIPPALAVLVPDLANKNMPDYNDFIFFDLETTGLSGGAGTIAFLAAFGKIINPDKLRVTQYLLLDYPGEPDFLDNILREFRDYAVIVTYNGKSFDSQILKTRCLMNGIKPPFYRHADLLHPSRRLWKKILADCSQASIEINVLGIERKDDISGSLAPEIWFEFLKTGITNRLTGICDHNINDISGLCSILDKIISIASNPLNQKNKYDIERLAFKWRDFLRRKQVNDDYFILTGEKLLRFCADKNYPKSVYIYGYDLMRKGNLKKSLKYVIKGLELFEEESIWHKKLLRRKEKLEKNINRLNL